MGKRYVWNKYDIDATYTERTTSGAQYASSNAYVANGYSFDKSRGTYQLTGATHLGESEKSSAKYVAPVNYPTSNIWEKTGSGYVYGPKANDPDYPYELYHSDWTSGVERSANRNASKGSLIGPASSSNSGKYPSDKDSGSYWYVYQGSDNIDLKSVSLPDGLMGGRSVEFSATPSNGKIYGGTVSYLYQYSTGDGSWKDIATTSNLSQSVTVPDGANTFQVRARAQDNIGFTSSDYIYSETRNVTNSLPPTAPGSIYVTGVVHGQNATITITASTDPDGTVESYIYERQVDKGAWQEIANVNSLSQTDHIDVEWGTVSYRACAVDNSGVHGPYTSSKTITVNDNWVIVGGPAESIGAKISPFDIKLTISTSDSSTSGTISVKASLDGLQIYSGDSNSGSQIFVPIDTRLLGAGEHVVEVQANKDSLLPASKRYTFTVPAVTIPDGGKGAISQGQDGLAVFHTTLAQRCVGRGGVDVQAQIDALMERITALEG